MCVCMCVRACVRATGEWISAQETCVDRAMENEGQLFSLCFFFSLSPSLLPEGQGLNPNVLQSKSIDCFFDA